MLSNKQLVLIIVFLLIVLGSISFKLFYSPKDEIEGDIFIDEINVIGDVVEIKGYVNGNGWIAFEGKAGAVSLFSVDGRKLSQSILKVKGDWMKEVVYFFAILQYESKEEQKGTLLFINTHLRGGKEDNREKKIEIDLLKTQ